MESTRILPSGCYDTGDGIFDPKTGRVTSFDDPTKILRIPGEDESEWIVKKCRKSWTEPTGYRPDLNENWSDDPPELPYNLPMSQDSPDPWWKRLTTFERDRNFLRSEREKDETGNHDQFQTLPEVCMCGQYTIIGEPCYCIPVSGNSGPGESTKSKTTLRSLDSEKYDKNNEVGYFWSESSKESFHTEIPNYFNAESSSRKNLGESDSDEKINKVEYVENFFETNVNFLLEVPITTELEDTTLKNNSPENESEDTVDRTKNFEKKDILQDDEEKKEIEVEMELMKNDRGEEKFDEDSRENEGNSVMGNELVKIVIEESDGENVEPLKDSIKDEILENGKDDKKSMDREEVKESEEETEEKVLQKSEEENYEENVDLLKNKYEEIANENSEKIINESSAIEEKSGVKVSESSIEPETNNDRRSKTKFLSKDLSLQDRDQELNELESIVKKSLRDQSQDASSANIDKILMYSMRQFPDDMSSLKKFPTYKTKAEVIDKQLQMTHYDDILLASSRNEYKYSFDEETFQKILECDKNLEDCHTSISPKDVCGKKLIIDKESTRQEKGHSFREDIVESEKFEKEFEPKFFMETNILSKFKTTLENDLACTKHDKDVLRIPKIISSKESLLASKRMDNKISNPLIISEMLRTVEDEIPSKDNLVNSKGIHPAPTSLLSTKQKSQKKKIVEIQSKNPSVWRLSGLSENYKPKNNVRLKNGIIYQFLIRRAEMLADFSIHSTLTTSTSKNMEYVEKPYNARIHGSTIPEVRKSASRTRKEFPSNVSAKLMQSSKRRNSDRK